MNFYVEITLLPGADIGLYQLWSKVFTQLHLRMVNTKESTGTVPIGIDWPEYVKDEQSLGTKIRLFSMTQEALNNLNVHSALSSFSDYVKISSIRNVPQKISTYVWYKRIQKKQNPERIARRKARRKNISFSVALKQVLLKNPPQISCPYIQLKSLSSKRKYSLFLEKHFSDSPTESFKFNSFGISRISRVPSF